MLTGPMIKAEVREGRITINPFNDENINPNSYNLTLDAGMVVVETNRVLRNGSRYVLDPTQPQHVVPVLLVPLEGPYDSERGYVLQPNHLYLASSVETVGSNEYIPGLEGRSSFARCGISCHETAGFFDVGFFGKAVFEITVKLPTILRPGQKIAQIYFARPEGEILLYKGKYQHQAGPTPCLLDRETTSGS